MMNDNKIAHYLKLAKNACLYSDCKRARLGCVIVCKNKTVSVGWNSQNKTSPTQKSYNRLRGYDPDATNDRSTLHAEMSAMLRARNSDIDWSKTSLFVYRIKRDGSRAMSRPCEACMGYAKTLGIKNFYYSTDDGWAYEQVKEVTE
jgi:deoxycytidylate deaminase